MIKWNSSIWDFADGIMQTVSIFKSSWLQSKGNNLNIYLHLLNENSAKRLIVKIYTHASTKIFNFVFQPN